MEYIFLKILLSVIYYDLSCLAYASAYYEDLGVCYIGYVRKSFAQIFTELFGYLHG